MRCSGERVTKLARGSYLEAWFAAKVGLQAPIAEQTPARIGANIAVSTQN